MMGLEQKKASRRKEIQGSFISYGSACLDTYYRACSFDCALCAMQNLEFHPLDIDFDQARINKRERVVEPFDPHRSVWHRLDPCSAKVVHCFRSIGSLPGRIARRALGSGFLSAIIAGCVRCSVAAAHKPSDWVQTPWPGSRIERRNKYCDCRYWRRRRPPGHLCPGTLEEKPANRFRKTFPYRARCGKCDRCHQNDTIDNAGRRFQCLR